MRHLLILGLLFLIGTDSDASDLGSQELLPSDPIPSYTMWMGGAKGRHAYDKAVTWLAMEKSRVKYGPYSLHTIEHRPGIERARIEAARADRFQVHISPNDEVMEESAGSLIRIKESVIKGILGYRRLIIRKADADKFKQIDSLSKLQTLSVGQGVRWPDVAVLRANNISVVQTHSIDSLFAMLNKKRFDAISLGINEAEGTLETVIAQYPDLIIEPNIVLFFPMSVYFYVNTQHPELAERLTYGIRKAKKDGSFDSLFALHFYNEIATINQSNIKFFTLKNDSMSSLDASQTPLLIQQH